MFSFVKDIIVDPFLGSGTTTLAAKNLGRNSVGYEINREFIPLIQQKLQTNQTEIFGAKYEFIDQGAIDMNFDQKISNLPYIFKDFHAFDKKIDPKKLQFGSKIDKNSNNRDEYYAVKEIISPMFDRINAQNGIFSKSLLIENVEKHIRRCYSYYEKHRDQKIVFLIRILISNGARKDLLQKLEAKKITYKTMYPDLVGMVLYCNLWLESRSGML